MTPDETLQSRLRLATAAAAAAVTVAIGLTIASVFGYAAPPPAVPVAEPAQSVAREAALPPKVVLVPVRRVAEPAPHANDALAVADVRDDDRQERDDADGRGERDWDRHEQGDDDDE